MVVYFFINSLLYHIFFYFLIKDRNMLDNALIGLKLYVFVFAVLYLLNRIISVLKVIRLKEGKVDTSKWTLFFTGASISYIITAIIMGL